MAARSPSPIFPWSLLRPDFPHNAENLERSGGSADRRFPCRPRASRGPTDRRAKGCHGLADGGVDQLSGGENGGRRPGPGFRRLNRIEYVNTLLRDLLGVEVDIETLPADGVAGGFDNVDAGLDLSATLVERYLETADAALEEVFPPDRPRAADEQRARRPDFARQAQHLQRKKRRVFGSTALIREHDVVYRTGGRARMIRSTKRGLRRQADIASGFSAKCLTAAQRPCPSWPTRATMVSGALLLTRKVGAFDVTDKPTVVEFIESMAAGESIRIAPHGPGDGVSPSAGRLCGAGVLRCSGSKWKAR